MTHQLVVKDKITGQCGLVDPLCPVTNTSIVLSLPSTLTINESNGDSLQVDLSGLVTDCCTENANAISNLMEIFINSGDLNNYVLSFNDNVGNSPVFTIDLSDLPNALCADQDFIDCISENSAFDETVTSISINQTNIDYIDENSTVTSLDLCPIVKDCETVTSLNKAGNVITFIDESGSPTSLDLSDIETDCCQENADAIAALTDVFVNSGDLNNYTLSFNDNIGNTPSFTIDLSDLPNALCLDQDFVDCMASNPAFDDTVTTLMQNTDGSFVYTNEIGAQTQIDFCSMTSGLPNFGPLQCS